MNTVVVIPFFNGERDTRECLQTLFADRPETKVVLVDDGSSEPAADALAAAFSSVDLVRMEKNQGFGAASNTGLRRAFEKGADAAFLVNNDTLFEPGMLARLEATLAEEPGAGLVAPLILAHPGGEIWSAGGNCRLEEAAAHNMVEPKGDRPYETEWLTGCAYLMPRRAYEAVGGFDERFFMYGEDVELSLRVRDAGFRLIVEPRARLQHKVSQFFGLLSPVKHYYQVRNLLEVMHRHLSPEAFAAARHRLARRTWERLLKDTYRHGTLGVRRFVAARRAIRDQAAGRLGRLDG